MNFNEFVGNEFLKNQFIHMAKSKKIPHSIILQGNAGLGKCTFAKLIAKLIFCENFFDTTCDECSNCKKIDNDVHPDLIFPETSGALETYNIATVRKIREDAYVLPNDANFKVYVFKDADNMNTSAQNALLKVIEEPPKHVIFIFTCKKSTSFLDTILSRSQVFSLNAVDKSKAVEFIAKKVPELSIEVIKKSVDDFNGNIGKSLEFLKSDGKNEAMTVAEGILKALLTPNEFEVLRAVSQIKSDKNFFKQVLNNMLLILRDAMVFNYITVLETSADLARQISKKISTKKILKLMNLVNEMNDLIFYNVNQNLLTTYLSSSCYSITFQEN